MTSLIDPLETLCLGEGEKGILLIHGSAAGAKPLRKLAELMLAENSDHRIVIPSLAGYGSVCQQAELPALQQHLAVINNAMAEHHCPSWHIIGHSMGGFLALKTALAHSERITSICVIEPMVLGVLESAADRQSLAEDRGIIQKLEQAMQDGQPEQGIAAFISYWNGTVWQQLPEAVRQHLLGLSEQIYADIKSVSRDTTPASAYAALSMPMLLLCGDQSPAPARLIVQRLASVLQRSTDQLIAGTGHLGLLQQPVLYAQAINQFLQQNR